MGAPRIRLRHRFLVALNLWMYVVLYVASIGLVTTKLCCVRSRLNADAVAAHRGILLATSVGIIGGLMLVAHLGLGVGKWVTNVGSALTVSDHSPARRSAVRTPRWSSRGWVSSPASRDAAADAFQLQRLQQDELRSALRFRIRGDFCRRVAQSPPPPDAGHLDRGPLIALLYIFGTSAILRMFRRTTLT